ncbi:hypothetical protein [Enterocloster hominis (ex Hitch et al. 2024)]|nr:hypothetical protein [Lachnoclostridium pacaense]
MRPDNGNIFGYMALAVAGTLQVQMHEKAVPEAESMKLKIVE